MTGPQTIAEPQTLQAEVQVKVLKPAEAKKAIDNAVETKNGQVKGITLTISILSPPDTYLVVRLPEKAVQDLLRTASALPADSQERFVSYWVMKNQNAVIGKHLENERLKKFTFTVVPASEIALPPKTIEATPKRAEEKTQTPVSRTGPPLTAVPIPTEERKNPPSVPAVGSGKLETKPPPSPAVEMRETPSLPKEIKGGNGTKARPFEVYRSSIAVRKGAKEEAKSEGENYVAFPVELKIEGIQTAYFTVNLTVSQITKKMRGKTQTDLWSILKDAILAVAAEKGVKLDESAFKDARPRMSANYTRLVEAAEKSDPAIRRYMNTH